MLNTAPSIYWKTNLSRHFKISLFIFSENAKKIMEQSQKGISLFLVSLIDGIESHLDQDKRPQGGA